MSTMSTKQKDLQGSSGPPSKRPKQTPCQQQREQPFDVLDVFKLNMHEFLDSKSRFKFAFCVSKSVKRAILQHFGGDEEFWKHLLGVDWRKENVSFLLERLTPWTPKECYRSLVTRDDRHTPPSRSKQILPPLVDGGVRPLQYEPKDYIVVFKVAGHTKVLKGENMTDCFDRHGEFKVESEDCLFVMTRDESFHFIEDVHLSAPEVDIEMEILRIPDQCVLSFVFNSDGSDFRQDTLPTDANDSQRVTVTNHFADFPQDEHFTEFTHAVLGEEAFMELVFEPLCLRQQSEDEFACYGFLLRFLIREDFFDRPLLSETNLADHIKNLHFVESAMFSLAERS